MGRLPLHARQPEGTVPRTLVPHGGMSALVQRRPRHGDPPVHRDVPAGRGAAAVTGRRVDVGGAWIDRSRPIGFTFDGRELTAFEGDTLASALLANGVDVVCRSPILGRPRGVVSAGVEESSAFVEVSKPCFAPIIAATMVDLVDGLVATGRPGVGVLPFDPPPTKPAVHRHAHVEFLIVGSGEGWHPAVEDAVQRGDRVLLVEREPRLAAAAPDGVTTLTHATALGLYDDGYMVVHERGPGRDT